MDINLLRDVLAPRWKIGVNTAGVRCAVYNGTFGAGFGHRFSRIANANATCAKAADLPDLWTVPCPAAYGGSTITCPYIQGCGVQM